MSRALVILLISWVCTGCVTAPARRPPGFEAVDPALRVAVGGPQAALLRQALLTSPALLARAGRPRRPYRGGLDDEGCHRFRILGPRRFVDGEPVSAAELVASWTRGVARPGAARWLLDPLVGARELALGLADDLSGLRAEGDALVVCVRRPVPDWSARLAHPALWLEAGAYRAEPSRFVATRGASIARVELLRPTGRGTATADLAVVYGAAVSAAMDASSSLRSERFPGWDRTYALWINPRSRWVNDPRFRLWLSAEIDRESALRRLFDGHGAVVYDLFGPGRRPQDTAASGRPFDRTSSPRLSLTYDRDDPQASTLAFRIKAVVDSKGVPVRLEARSGAEARDLFARSEYQMALIAHEPPIADPLLGLRHTLSPLGPETAETLARLDRASAIADPARRAERARELAGALVSDGRLVPLLRIEAWLVRRGDLRRVEAAPYGVLHFDRMVWRR